MQRLSYSCLVPMKRIASAALGCLLAASCHKPPAMQNARRDMHSYSNPEQTQVRDVDLDIEVLFDRKILKGSATLTLERREPGAPSLILDTRDLTIEKVEQAPEDGAYKEAKFTLGAADPIL